MKFKNIKTGTILTASNDTAIELMRTSPNFEELKETPKTDKKTAKSKKTEE